MVFCEKCKRYYRGIPKIGYVDYLWHKDFCKRVVDKFDEIFAWLHHYEYEFNESPHPMVNKVVKQLQKYSDSYEWK